MSWDPAEGTGVDAVRVALRNFETRAGDFAAVKDAVSKATFGVKPTALSVDELAANWEYQPMVDTFNDTVQVALFTKVITKSQYDQLLEVANFNPEPSREAIA